MNHEDSCSSSLQVYLLLWNGNCTWYFNSLPAILIIAEPDLVSSSFSQSDLQSRSPEAIFKISDPESINRKKLTAWTLCKKNYLPMFFSFALTSAGHRNQPYSYNINTLFLYLFQVHSPLEVTVLSVDKVCPGDDSVEHSLSRE